MNPLHRLRLNCLLVPLLIGGAAAAILVVSHRLAHRQLVAESRSELTRAVAAWAGLRGQGLAISPAAWRQADPRWRGAAELRLRDDRLQVSQGSGMLRLGDEPPADLPAAVSAPQCWAIAGGGLAAVAVVHPYREPSPLFLYAETAAPEPAVPGLWPGLAAIAALSTILGWYLMRRIWRPVESLQRHADAALDGLAPPVDAEASDETAAVRSSVIRLAERYRGFHATGSPPSGP